MFTWFKQTSSAKIVLEILKFFLSSRRCSCFFYQRYGAPAQWDRVFRNYARSLPSGSKVFSKPSLKSKRIFLAIFRTSKQAKVGSFGGRSLQLLKIDSLLFYLILNLTLNPIILGPTLLPLQGNALAMLSAAEARDSPPALTLPGTGGLHTSPSSLKEVEGWNKTNWLLL